MKLGVITNGISRDLEYALQAMAKAGLKYAELQFLWDKEVGDQTPEEIEKIKNLVTQYQVEVSCISRHNFAGLPVMEIELEDAIYQEHIAGLERCIRIAQDVGNQPSENHEFQKRDDYLRCERCGRMGCQHRCLG